MLGHESIIAGSGAQVSVLSKNKTKHGRVHDPGCSDGTDPCASLRKLVLTCQLCPYFLAPLCPQVTIMYFLPVTFLCCRGQDGCVNIPITQSQEE